MGVVAIVHRAEHTHTRSNAILFSCIPNHAGSTGLHVSCVLAPASSLRVRKCVSACRRGHMCDLGAVNRVFIVATTWRVHENPMSYCAAVRHTRIATRSRFLHFRSGPDTCHQTRVLYDLGQLLLATLYESYTGSLPFERAEFRIFRSSRSVRFRV